MIEVKLINDPMSSNSYWADVNTETGEIRNHRFSPEPGKKNREVFKLDKTTRKLVKTNEYNVDKYINSFREETNIKDMVERLRAKGVSAEEYLKRNGGFFKDISEAPSSVLEAVMMANDFEDKVDAYEKWNATRTKKEETPKEEIKKEEKESK